MICSNCGKSVPFVGKKCPYCRNDKSKDQTAYAYAVMGIFLGGTLAFVFDGGFLWILGLAIAGLVLGYGIGMAVTSKPEREEDVAECDD